MRDKSNAGIPAGNDRLADDRQTGVALSVHAKIPAFGNTLTVAQYTIQTLRPT